MFKSSSSPFITVTVVSRLARGGQSPSCALRELSACTDAPRVREREQGASRTWLMMRSTFKGTQSTKHHLMRVTMTGETEVKGFAVDFEIGGQTKNV